MDRHLFSEVVTRGSAKTMINKPPEPVPTTGFGHDANEATPSEEEREKPDHLPLLMLK